jgi:predicted RecB family nuclease
MNTSITASMLYDYVQCPHRVYLDIFGDPNRRDPISAFVQLLWERGSAFERETIEKLQIPFENLQVYSTEEKERLTAKAMKRGDSLIYGGRIRIGNLLGEPDLLRREGTGYVAGDIKSGAGFEGMSEETDGKPKKHYAVQLGLYTDILDKLGLSAGHNPFVWDVHSREVTYELDLPMGKRDTTSLWGFYEACLDGVSLIVDQKEKTLPALCSMCKLCHWRSFCLAQLKGMNDLSLIPELGRTRRDAMLSHFKNVGALANCDLKNFIQGKKTVIPGIGSDMLETFQERAKLLNQPETGPYLKDKISLPHAESELFFDVETDPMRDICYLHGFIERRNSDAQTEKYVIFFADQPTPEDELKAFKDAWNYIQRRRPCLIYYYSPYERTIWRKLQKRYSDVMTEADIENMFSTDVAVDLYLHVVKSKTEWPTNDYSIKTLATYLGFKWRDKEPSGAASIEWYHRWVETGDAAIRQRIIDYNEDDCIAMRVLLDAIKDLPIKRMVSCSCQV